MTAVPDLSICVIARDEEGNLPVLFDSLAGLRGRPDVQIVVVDTGSRDGTPALAARLGAEVHAFAWRDDFSAARNHALSLCRGRLILWLDADDALPPATAGALAAGLRAWDASRAWAFRVRSPGPGGTATEAHQIRLVPNGRSLEFRNPVHESLGESVAEAGLPVADAGLAILHLGYRDAALVDRKHRRNLALLEKALSAPDPSPSLLLTYARLCLALRRGPAAEAALRRALRRAGSAPAGGDLARAARLHLAQSLMLQGRPREAVEALRADPTLGGGHGQYLLEFGKALWLDGRAAEARVAWRAALAAPPCPTSVPTDWEAVRAGARKLLEDTAPAEGHSLVTDTAEIPQGIPSRPEVP